MPSAANDNTPRLLTLAEAAAYCSLSESGFSSWTSRGIVPGPVPGTKRYDRRAIDRALDVLSGIAPAAEPTSAYDAWKAGSAR